MPGEGTNRPRATSRGNRSCETLDSMELLLRLAEGEEEPIESLGELIRRTEYVEETLRRHAPGS